MTLYEFLALDLGDRMVHVVDSGEFLAQDDAVPSNFYAIGDFFVEVIMDTATQTISEVTPFREGERYDRLLGRIRVVEMWH